MKHKPSAFSALTLMAERQEGHVRAFVDYNWTVPE